MALANAALELSQRGRRVLVVDFDLEAPGIPTYSFFAGASHCKGVVDYVTEYLQTGQAPNITEFVIRCEPHDAGSGGVWCMPAGKQNYNYAARLNSIDWQDLYRDRDGYLLIEDMKNQWQKAFSPDYVLIDSRTGHTDVGGICTRQLPDAVCVLFLPNDENIIGLKGIVSGIRQETSTSFEDSIKLHFIPSNVPEIDDEKGILQSILDTSKSALEYTSPSATIHHYNSLDLLKQAIFTKERKKTRLSAEYRKLVDAIVTENLEDREGAKEKLEHLRSSLLTRGALSNVELKVITEDVKKIKELHREDGEILHLLGLLHRRIGTPDEEISFQSKAIELNYQLPKTLLARATAYRMKSKNDLAIVDLLRVLDLDKVNPADIFSAIKWLEDLDFESLLDIGNSLAVQNLEDSDQFIIAQLLTNTPNLFSQREKILNRLLIAAPSDSTFSRQLKSELILSFITERRFDETPTLFGNKPPKPSDLNEIMIAFNVAMSEWGRIGVPSQDLFCHVAEIDTQDPSASNNANYCECLAIANAICGRRDKAVMYLEKAKEIARFDRTHIFSCWRYQRVSSDEFLEDLVLIENWLDDRTQQPQFLRGEKTDI